MFVLVCGVILLVLGGAGFRNNDLRGRVQVPGTVVWLDMEDGSFVWVKLYLSGPRGPETRVVYVHNPSLLPVIPGTDVRLWIDPRDPSNAVFGETDTRRTVVGVLLLVAGGVAVVLGALLLLVR